MAQLAPFEHADTHRLIPARYASGSPLKTLPLPAEVLADLSELDTATSERKQAESGRNPAIGPNELLYGVAYASIVNAAFTYPGPFGGRFHTHQRGAWYASVDLKTSIEEVRFHKGRFLREARMEGEYTFEYTDYLADFSGEYHHLDRQEKQTCLQPDPVPQCYTASQALAGKLLHAGSNGIVYPSVRRKGGTCIACFRPALVFNPRLDQTHRIVVRIR